ncbi:MAG: hypothetical protein LBJ10_11610, partial [Clostridiales bacterium]|jgi:hypothetical protein|nr:hypothetical protein [Clostridiales bacterium]
VSWGDNYLQTPFVNGGQCIFYPGEHFGTDELLPSIRLKAMRNQMQLGDLMMTANGLDCETLEYVWNDLRQIVNDCFGYGGMDRWWQPKPDFLGTPPRYWQFGDKVRANNHIGACSPWLIEDLRRGLLNRLG